MNKNVSAAAYSRLAPYYDKLMTDCDYEQWSQYLYDLISETADKNGQGADGGCGSGRMTAALSKKGLRLFGFDVSGQMLAAAAETARKTGEQLVFVKADLASFKAHKKLSYLTCSCDAFNYIAQGDRVAVFKHIAGQLKSGGALLFDISSSYKLRTVIGNNVFYEDGEDVTMLWTNKQTAAGVDMELTFFVREGERYLRYDEHHTQYAHETEDVLGDLRAAGFSADAYAFLTRTAPDKQAERIQFVARKYT